MPASGSLTRAERVRRRADFVRIQGGPSVRIRGPGFLLLAVTTDRAERGCRFGVVASRKVGNAVARNRAKRLLRELFRLHKDELPAALDVVFVALQEIAGATLASLEASLPNVLRELRARVRRGQPAPSHATGLAGSHQPIQVPAREDTPRERDAAVAPTTTNRRPG